MEAAAGCTPAGLMTPGGGAARRSRLPGPGASAGAEDVVQGEEEWGWPEGDQVESKSLCVVELGFRGSRALRPPFPASWNKGPLEGLRVHPAPSPAAAPVEEAAGSLCRMPRPQSLLPAPLTLLIPLQLQLEKHKGEILGVVVVESGWGSILPTVILANMMNGGPAARSGKLSIGDQIMSINGTSLVGLPLATCQGIIKRKSITYPKLSKVAPLVLVSAEEEGPWPPDPAQHWGQWRKLGTDSPAALTRSPAVQSLGRCVVSPGCPCLAKPGQACGPENGTQAAIQISHQLCVARLPGGKHQALQAPKCGPHLLHLPHECPWPWWGLKRAQDGTRSPGGPGLHFQESGPPPEVLAPAGLGQPRGSLYPRSQRAGTGGPLSLHVAVLSVQGEQSDEIWACCRNLGAGAGGGGGPLPVVCVCTCVCTHVCLGEICSLMRGGIAERGGVRVGHRIIEINGQSVVATAHEKIVQALSNSVGEIHMKTMPAAMFRLLTGQETPLYI
ncbi:PREDICTED: uncharacterized protein LOC105516917 [Colobus angolensis palliatus]|uniref:uncharacterized protein LOC105516917 n=1 Tax=Colobus angolensis palliatus TaxID=336983 RepID=UPI0005F46EA0|nr:PREDICTED: uncharacterized protein LOC105516917 [Colobus angolensis palliatus]